MEPNRFEGHSYVLSQGVTPFEGEDQIMYVCKKDLHIKLNKESVKDTVYFKGGGHIGSGVRIHGAFRHCIGGQGILWTTLMDYFIACGLGGKRINVKECLPAGAIDGT